MKHCVLLVKKELTKQDAYMNSLFHGDWHTFVRDKNGKMLWPVHSPTKAHAELAAKWLESTSRTILMWISNSLEVKHSPSVKVFLAITWELTQKDPRIFQR